MANVFGRDPIIFGCDFESRFIPNPTVIVSLTEEHTVDRYKYLVIYSKGLQKHSKGVVTFSKAINPVEIGVAYSVAKDVVRTISDCIKADLTEYLRETIERPEEYARETEKVESLSLMECDTIENLLHAMTDADPEYLRSIETSVHDLSRGLYAVLDDINTRLEYYRRSVKKSVVMPPQE